MGGYRFKYEFTEQKHSLERARGDKFKLQLLYNNNIFYVKTIILYFYYNMRATISLHDALIQGRKQDSLHAKRSRIGYRDRET